MTCLFKTYKYGKWSLCNKPEFSKAAFHLVSQKPSVAVIFDKSWHHGSIYVWQHSSTHAQRSKLEPDLQYSHQVRSIHWRPELTSTYNGNMNNTNLKSIPSDTIETFNALQCIGGTCCSIPPLNENTLRA